MKTKDTTSAKTITPEQEAKHAQWKAQLDFPDSIENRKRIVISGKHEGSKDVTTKLIAQCYDEQIAERIIASLNSYDKLRADNERMLEALKHAQKIMVKYAKFDSDSVLSMHVFSDLYDENQINNAIAQAEGREE